MYATVIAYLKCTILSSLDIDKMKSVLCSEFDSFLADRAQAPDTLPTIAATTGQRSRKLQKDDEENPLFAL
jgi:hypothetical protein